MQIIMSTCEIMMATCQIFMLIRQNVSDNIIAMCMTLTVFDYFSNTCVIDRST